jgi:hypothetical protein
MSATGERHIEAEAQALTPPARWTEALAGRTLPAFDPTAYGRLVVVAAHPDDETLAVGGGADRTPSRAARGCGRLPGSLDL